MERGEDGITRWRRVADDLRGAIADGSVADRLPSEDMLARRYGVNRHTVRRAVAALARDGLVRAQQGRGTFVVAAPERLLYPVGARTRFSENVAAQARQPAGRLIHADRVRADSELSSLLECPVGTELHRLERLHVADGLPLSLATSWLCVARFPDIVRAYAESGSITEALRRAGVADYRRRETRLTAEPLSPTDAGHLAAGAGALALVSRALDVDLDERPIQALRTRFHAERVELVFRH